MHEKLDKGLLFGFAGNVLFVAFGLICAVFYFTYEPQSLHSRALEAIAYCTEFLGFGLLIYSDVLLSVSLRLRRLLKISYTAYIVLEALIMVLELNEPKLDFYLPYSVWLAVIHAVISGLVCFAFLQLDPDNTRFEIALVACVGLVFFGMMGAIFGIRVYFSVIINAVAFSLLFGIIRYFRSREEIEIDCNGDRAPVAEYSSTMFIDPDELKKAAEAAKAKADEDWNKAIEGAADEKAEEPASDGEKKE